MKIEYISWLVTCLSLTGVILNIYKSRMCFFIWTFTNGFWCIYDFSKGMYSQGSLMLVYFILAIFGIIKWTREKGGASNADKS